jgi:hypothetical protein
MMISTPTKIIKYISACYQGKCHDYQLLKTEFPPEQNWFEKCQVRIDLGYLGFKKDYVCQQVFIPYKKTKLNPLTESQKETNKQYAAERITVEHSIGGMKRYRILSDILRTHLIAFYDDVLAVCPGLWNFYLTN